MSIASEVLKKTLWTFAVCAGVLAFVGGAYAAHVYLSVPHQFFLGAGVSLALAVQASLEIRENPGPFCVMLGLAIFLAAGGIWHLVKQ